MNTEVLTDAESVAERAASVIADYAWESIGSRGSFTMAVSGGHTPWVMLRLLAAATIPWRAVRIVQVDERVAPAGHPDRNLTHIFESLLPHSPLHPDQIYAMPVESPDLGDAASAYAATLRKVAGELPILDLVHLGLGPDGHTASLVPGDPVLDVDYSDVALSGPYQGRRRMTLTYPILNRARRILWVVTGGEKAGMVNRLLNGDREIPAGRVSSDHALLLADAAAAGQCTSESGGVLCA
ncbi:MAG TPA: 6-phosphogluconolactonase [Bryobacteraceae bacterium]|nr:6-phosphogluconolactonase [Bryobacteraceae bacterium]